MAVDRTDIETGRLLSAVVTWPDAQLTEHGTAGSVAPAAPKSSIRSQSMGPGTPPQTALPVAGFPFGASWAARVGTRRAFSGIKCHGPSDESCKNVGMGAAL
jgi:hypothetical protein